MLSGCSTYAGTPMDEASNGWKPAGPVTCRVAALRLR